MGLFDCCSAYRIIVIVNGLIVFFGLFLIGVGIYSLTNYGDGAFFSREIYAFMVIFGMLTFVLAYLACTGGRDPKDYPNYLFCYWCIVSLILVGSFAGFYYFRIFTRGIENTVDNSRDQVFSVIETELAKQYQDFVLSTYTACCTGCDDVGEPDLFCIPGGIDAVQVTGEQFCADVSRQVDLVDDLEPGNCVFAEICSQAQLEEQFNETGAADGLGLGCYTSGREIPNFPVGVDTCAVFQELTLDDRPLVGPALNGFSCGGGEPAKYLQNTFDYFESVYFLVAVPWGFLMFFLALAWLASVYLIMCRPDNDRKR